MYYSSFIPTFAAGADHCSPNPRQTCRAPRAHSRQASRQTRYYFEAQPPQSLPDTLRAERELLALLSAAQNYGDNLTQREMTKLNQLVERLERTSGDEQRASFPADLDRLDGDWTLLFSTQVPRAPVPFARIFLI